MLNDLCFAYSTLSFEQMVQSSDAVSLGSENIVLNSAVHTPNDRERASTRTSYAACCGPIPSSIPDERHSHVIQAGTDHLASLIDLKDTVVKSGVKPTL